MRNFVGAAMLAMLWAGNARAECPSLPNQIANGQPADASKVMGDFNHLRDCLNGDVGSISTPSITIKSPAGPAVIIKAPTVATSYDFNLPSGPGIAGQVLKSGGSGQTTWGAGGSGGGNAIDGNPTVRPDPSILTWIDQSFSTLTNYPGGPVTMRIESAGSNNMHAVEMPIPGPNFTLTAKLDCLVSSGYNGCGIFVRDNASRFVFLGYASSSLGVATRSGFVGNGLSIGNTFYVYSAPKWFRIMKDSTNWTYLVSSNGADWIEILKVPNASSYLTTNITAAGVTGLSTSSYAMTIPIWSLELKTGTGTNSSWQ